MNIVVRFSAQPADFVEYKQKEMGPEEWTHCELIEGWVIISDRWGKRIVYPARRIYLIETTLTHRDSGS